MVTSLEFRLIRCATTLCHFGRTRNGYVVTHFILVSSIPESSATSGYVVVPERFGQNEEPVSRNGERTRKKRSFVPSSEFKQCKMYTHVNMNFFHHFSCILFFVFYLYLVHFLVVSSYGKTLSSFVFFIIY